MKATNADQSSSEALSAEELAAFPAFGGMTTKDWETVLKFNPEAIVRRRFGPGELLCNEGEYVYTAFYILSGRAKMYLAAPMGHVTTANIGMERRTQTIIGSAVTGTGTSMMSLLSRESDRFATGQTYIPVDASVDLSMEDCTAVLEPGSLIGETSCLNLYPRSCTVEAVEECVVFEFHRNVLDKLKSKSPSFKSLIENTYRDRSLGVHLRSAPEFAELPDAYIERLKAKAELTAYEPGAVIVEEGAVGDDLFLVRLGHVKVSKRYPSGDLVLAYMSRGNYFGVNSALLREPADETFEALDHVELVRIDKVELDYMVSRFPAIRSKLEETARKRRAQRPSVVPSTVELRLDQLVEHGLMNAQDVLMIDLVRCTRCDECVHACAEAHEGVSRLLRDGLRYGDYLVATSCRQCTDPMCMIGCPVGSIRRRESLEVIIEDWCIGCDKCAKNCPFGNISMHEFTVDLDRLFPGQQAKAKEVEGPRGTKRAVVKKATTCDLCLDLPQPSCVYACPHDAAIRGRPADIMDREKAKPRWFQWWPFRTKTPVAPASAEDPFPVVKREDTKPE